MRNSVIGITILFFIPFFLLIASSCSSNNSSTASQPNIIFIMADDHAFQALSAYGSMLNSTPNLDKLANEGMRFDRAFVTNSICSPSRAVILTGKFSHLNGLRDNRQIFDSTQQTLPKLLQTAGYETAVVGKWHLKSQPTGFDYWQVLPGQGEYYNPEFRTTDGIVKVAGYVTDIITDLAIDWLGSRKEQAKPFFLMYHHKAPHREWVPSPEHLTTFKDQDIPEAESLFDDYANRGRAAKEAEMRIRDHMGLTNDTKIRPDIVKNLGMEEFSTWYEWAYNKNYDGMTEDERAQWDAVYGPINEEFAANPPEGDDLVRWKYKRYMEDYLASISSIDDNVGRLLKYLKQTGLDENTVVIYTSDQGFYLGEHGWFDKRFMYEESFRTPLIVRWPGTVTAGSVNSDLVQNLDFAQTILDMCSVDQPADMQGQSLVPILRGQQTAWRDGLYYHYYEYPGIHMVKRHYGIRTDRYKLIHFYHDIDEWELYDLEDDPQEMMNLYNQQDYEEIQAQMHQKLDELRRQYNDSDSLAQAMLEADLALQK